MDWCVGNSLQDLLVPQDQEKFQSFLSPENWSIWEISASECHNTPTHKFFGMDGYVTPTQSFRGLSDNSSSQETSRPDCQLHDFSGIEQMDDIFLNSFLEDVPGNSDIQESFRSVSSASKHGFQAADENNVSTDMDFDFQSISDGNNHLECSSYLQTRDELYDPSQRFECTSGKLDSIPPKLKASSEENSAGVVFPEEQSLEESVLQEFQRVTKKVTKQLLTERSRKCFRDTFYRLAKNSEQKSSSQSSNKNLPEKTPKWMGQEAKTRSGRKRTVESETNVIDRAVANLTFNRIDSNVHDFPLPGSINSEESFIQMVESPDPQSYYQQIQHLPQTPAGVADVFAWRNADVESRRA